MSFYDRSSNLPSAGYSQIDTSPQSIENALQQASVLRSLSARLANAKPVAISGLSLSTTHISAAPGGIRFQVPVYKHFHPHVPSLYMPGLDDHIEGQRVLSQRIPKDILQTFRFYKTLTTSVHIIICGKHLGGSYGQKWDPSRHKHRRIRSTKATQGKVPSIVW